MKQVRLTKEELSALCLSLAQLFHAGIGAGDALALMAEDETDPAYRKLLEGMAARADEGTPLAEIFREAGVFPVYVYGLLNVGQQVGKLEETLGALGTYYGGRARMERRLRAALLYPSVLMVVLLAVVVVMLVWVLPVFNDVYAQLGSSLTGVAGGLLALGAGLRKAMPVLGVLLAAVVAVAALAAALPSFRERLLAPWRARQGERGVSRAIQTARFAQALSLGMSSGLTAQESVDLAVSLAEEAPKFQARCRGCLDILETGAAVPAALRESGLLSRSDCRLLEAGIRGGCGETVMEQIAGRLLEDSEAALEGVMGRIEPTLVVVMSVMVGTILLSVMLPLMHIMTAIG